MVGILGKKIGMTQIFKDGGQIVPVTIVAAGPCSILQLKTKQKDGYNAIQLGFEDTKASRLNKPLAEKFKKIKVSPKKFIKEISMLDVQGFRVGQCLDVSEFKPGDFVDIVGTSKGHGFQGGIKRWHWSGGPKSHGSMSHRAPGSIGASAFPSRVYKGHHLPGHMGNQKVTVQNLEVIQVDKEKHLLVVKGSVPGHRNSYLIIKKAKKKISKTEQKDAVDKKVQQQDKQGQNKSKQGKK
jgi:large subunit ribosomal protein L3